MVTYLFMDAISFPTNFGKAFTDKLNETLPPNIKLKDCMQIMAEHNLLYKLTHVNPKLFLFTRLTGVVWGSAHLTATGMQQQLSEWVGTGKPL